VKTTALHLVAEEPITSRAFSDLRTWILGGEAASSSLHEVETETNARIREVARLLLQEHIESRGIVNYRGQSSFVNYRGQSSFAVTCGDSPICGDFCS